MAMPTLRNTEVRPPAALAPVTRAPSSCRSSGPIRAAASAARTSPASAMAVARSSTRTNADARSAGSTSIASSWVPPIALTCAPRATQPASTSGTDSAVEVVVQMTAASTTASLAVSHTVTATRGPAVSRTHAANRSVRSGVRE